MLPTPFLGLNDDDDDASGVLGAPSVSESFGNTLEGDHGAVFPAFVFAVFNRVLIAGITVSHPRIRVLRFLSEVESVSPLPARS